MKKCLSLIILSLLSIQAYSQITVQKSNDKWELRINEQAFQIKGATFGYGNDIENYEQYFQDLQFLGVNTIRTWATDENTIDLLNAADKHGIKVMLGIWMRHGRPGMEDDDSFNYLENTKGMEAMYIDAMNAVNTYKDHPAVLSWGVGNEVYLNTATDEEKIAYSKFLEKVCSQIKILDPDHPIISVEAWTFGLEWWEKYVPSIDIYGLNSYGAGAGLLGEELKKRNIDKPYIITEFGVTGEWDIQDEKNGIKREPSDQEKYDAIVQGYNDWIKPNSSCLGVYIFHYADGDKFIAPWLFTHYRGLFRPQYWAIREAYTGEKPINFVPIIKEFSVINEMGQSSTWVPLKLEITDREKEKLNISFYYNQRTGSRRRRDQLLPLVHRGSLTEGFEIQLPKEHGAIKVYVNAADEFKNVGIASTSIVVNDDEAKKIKYLVPKVILPFYVYQDNTDLPYYPSGYMGNYEAIELDLSCREEVHSGETSIKIRYNAIDNWYGIAFVDPANDWGDILGGYNISGAKSFSFWAKADDTGVKATLGFGLIKDDKSFPDSDIESIDLILTKDWKKYTIKTKKSDLSCIRSGFVLFSSSDGFRHSIYIDDIVFE